MSHGPCCVCGRQSSYPIFFVDANEMPKMVCMTCATYIVQKYLKEPD